MFSFDSSSFAIAGAIASAGPIIIHLLNRRRFRTVSWAAMDFLREALERNRKILHLRDLLLLALRMLTVVLFGLVLAKPFFKGAVSGAIWQAGLLGFSLLLVVALSVMWATASKGRSTTSGMGLIAALLFAGFQLSGYVGHASVGYSASSRAPVHAVLVIDNSRSLGVESLGGTLLDRARGKAGEFIDALPPESRITVIPLAGSEDPFTLDAYRNKDDARRALERIKIVDTEGSVRGALELADQACQQSFDLPSKRVVILTDGQANAWQELLAPELIQRLSGLQIVNVATGPARNVWVSGFHIEDGLTSAEVPCRLLARIHASETVGAVDVASTAESFEVQAKLTIDGAEVASQAVEMVPGQEREIEFSYQFDQMADPLRPMSVLATINVQADLQSADQLRSDNRQQVVIPIVSSMPVVFVDQYGDDENLDQGKVGETYALRHLMSPRASSDKSQRRLIHVEHVRADQVTQELLETVRLVVVAGLEKPDEAMVTLLEQFVRQGGPLVILAGGQFDPVAWTERAWRNGRGILPSPLEPKSLGETPEEASKQLRPFFASFASMQHDFFLIEGEDSQSLASLFEATPFFKAAQANVAAQTLEELLKSDAKQFAEEKRFLDQYVSRREAGRDRPTDSDDDDRWFRTLEPAWWQWRSALPLVDRSMNADELAKRSQPRVLAQFDGNGRPFVVERRMGAGRVVFFTSGVTSNWNMLRGSGAMYLFHRTFCQLMEQTLPTRNFVAGQRISLPVERRTDTRLTAIRPSGVKESLSIDAISPTVSGVTVRRPVTAGTYVVTSEQNDSSGSDATATKVDEILLAVNGAESESNLESISVSDLQQKLGHDDVHVLAADQPIRIEGGARRGLDLWKLFGWSVLACLLLEKAVLAWSSIGNKQLQR